MCITPNNNNSTPAVAMNVQNGVVPNDTTAIANSSKDNVNIIIINSSNNNQEDAVTEGDDVPVLEEDATTGSEQQQPEEGDGDDLVWYFSYGSNMNPEVFEEKRKIKSRDYRVCRAPGYVLSYTESILPYLEPGFCTCLKRSDLLWEDENEESRRPDIHGVAFLITRQQYDHMLLTEGGWGYQEYRNSIWDVGHYGEEEIECVEIEPDRICCQSIPTSTPQPNRRFKALTLTGLFNDGQIYDANASKRYYDIVNKGAKSSGLPASYREYLRTKHSAYEPTNCWKAKLALQLYIVASIPIFFFEIGTLKLCVLLNERKMMMKKNESSTKEEETQQEQRQRRRKKFEDVIRPPWIVLKLCYWYRCIVLERMVVPFLFDWCKFPNGFRNPCVGAAAAEAAAASKKTQ